MSLEIQGSVQIHIDFPGLGDLGVWENRTGGDGDSDSIKHREGGMGPILALGGTQTLDNLTVARRYDLTRDHPFIKTLYRARGRAKMTVVEQPLDEFGVAFGDPTTYAGKLKKVTPGNIDSNSNSVRMIELELDTESIS